MGGSQRDRDSSRVRPEQVSEERRRRLVRRDRSTRRWSQDVRDDDLGEPRPRVGVRESDRQDGACDHGRAGDDDGPGRATDGQHEQERDSRELGGHSHTDRDPGDGPPVPDDRPERHRLKSEHQRVRLSEADRLPERAPTTGTGR